jgi:hypothetical protein
MSSTSGPNGSSRSLNGQNFRITKEQDIQQKNWREIALGMRVGTSPSAGRGASMTGLQKFVWVLAAIAAFTGKSSARSAGSGSQEGNNVSDEMQPVEEVPGHLLAKNNKDPWNSRELTDVEYINSKEWRSGMVSGSQSRETLGSASQESSESSVTPFRLGEAPDNAPWRKLSQGKAEEGESIKSGNRIQYSDAFQNRLTQTIEISQRGIYQSQHKAFEIIMRMTDSLEPLPEEELGTSLRKLASEIKNANNGLADVSELKRYQTGDHPETAKGQAIAEVDKRQSAISQRLLRIVDLYQQYQGQVAAGDTDPVPRLKQQMLELKDQMKNHKHHINEVQQEIHTWKTQTGEESQQMIVKEHTAETHDDLSLHKIKENLRRKKEEVQDQFTQIKEFPHMAKRSPSQQQRNRLLSEMVQKISDLWQN